MKITPAASGLSPVGCALGTTYWCHRLSSLGPTEDHRFAGGDACTTKSLTTEFTEGNGCGPGGMSYRTSAYRDRLKAGGAVISLIVRAQNFPRPSTHFFYDANRFFYFIKQLF